MGMMMALRAHERGGPEQLVYESAPVPVPGPGEALVEVRAAAITFAELSWDLSWTTRDGQDRTPIIPSHEVSGTVAALGDGVDGLAVGDDVLGLIDFDRDGAAAEYVALPAATWPPSRRRSRTWTRPRLPLAALTAWQALVDHAALRPGEHVLVLGGAGGVGMFAVQLAASLGGTRHHDRRARQRRLRPPPSARHVVLTPDAGNTAGYKAVAPDGFDVVLDTVGGAALAASYELTRDGGRLVTLGSAPDQERAAARNARAIFFIVESNPGELATLRADDRGGHPADGSFTETFPLADGRRAYETGAQHRPPGKTVLIVR